MGEIHTWDIRSIYCQCDDEAILLSCKYRDHAYACLGEFISTLALKTMAALFEFAFIHSSEKFNVQSAHPKVSETDSQCPGWEGVPFWEDNQISRLNHLHKPVLSEISFYGKNCKDLPKIVRCIIFPVLPVEPKPMYIFFD